MKHFDEDWRAGGFGLYIHWPFCASKCPYCDFNSHVAFDIPHDAWRDAYVHEIERMAALTSGRTLETVFFGGGTPSTMQPDTVDSIMAAVRKAWPMRNSVEVTMEANPTSVELAKFKDFSGAGINRVSLGVQALNNGALRALGRLHTVEEALRAWDVASSVFERTSLDLIYARQHQSLADWKVELARALSLTPSHMSLYQLTIEDGTAFGERYRLGKLPGLPSADDGADLYEATQEMCEEAGLAAYEVSNHAVPGQESRHNLIYWRYGDYVGIGPGAHGRLTLNGRKFAFENQRSPAAWLKSVQTRSQSHEMREALSRDDIATEFLLMSLRLTEGMDLSRWQRMKNTASQPRSLNELVSKGFLWQDGDRVGATDTGRQVLNAVLRELA